MKPIQIRGFFLFSMFYLLSLGSSSAQCFSKGGSQNGSHGSGGKGGSESVSGEGIEWFIQTVHAVDPNDIIGPKGYEEKQWVSVNDKLQYKIRFENNPEFATAPAQNVYINLPVDPRININSLRLGDFGFWFYNFKVPENSTFYTTRLDVRDSLNVYVDVTAGIDITKNEVFWIFQSVDPITGLAPTNALDGFLPVNDTTITRFNDLTPKKGEGFVSFLINPKKELATEDTVSAQASIVFDINDPILTNLWTNTIDAVAPTSQINSYTVSQDSITLHWAGQDDELGTGVRDYSLYVSEGSAAFTPYESKIRGNSASFAGVPGAIYRFFTLATDNVGKQEQMKKEGEITVIIPANPTTGSVIVLVGKVKLQGRPEAPDARWQASLGVDIYEAGQTTPVASYSPVTDEHGTFTLDSVEVSAGKYVVTVKNSHTLKSARAAAFSPGENLLDFGELREGDANNDNKVTILDFSILSGSFNRVSGSSGYDDRADFNEDEQVTILDFSLLSGNFNRSGYEVTDTSFSELEGMSAELEGQRLMLSTSAVYLEMVKPEHVLKKGEEFAMPVMLHTEEQEIDGAEVHLEFDPAVLQVTGVTAGEHLPIGLLNSFDNKAGKISFASGALAQLPKGDLTLLTINFKIVGETGETPVTFTGSHPGETLVTYRGKSILGGVTNGLVEIENCFNCAASISKAYPNPTSGKFTLSMNGAEEGQARVSVIRVDGAVIRTLAVDLKKNENIEIDISDQAAGIYLIRLEVGNTTTIHRILKR